MIDVWLVLLLGSQPVDAEVWQRFNREYYAACLLLSSRLNHMTVQYTESRQGKAQLEGKISRNNEFIKRECKYYEDLGVLETVACGGNEYFFRIVRKPGKAKWEVVGVRRRGPEWQGFKLDQSETNTSLKEVVLPIIQIAGFSLSELVSKPSKRLLAAASMGVGEAERINLKFALDEPEFPVVLVDVTLVPALNWAIEDGTIHNENRRSGRAVPKGQARTKIRVRSELQKVDDLIAAKTVTTWYAASDDLDRPFGEPVLIDVHSISTSKLPISEFLPSHYGLPDSIVFPERKSWLNARNLTLLGSTVGFTACVVLFLCLRRRAKG